MSDFRTSLYDSIVTPLQHVADKASQTWPARTVKGLVDAAMLPGNVYQGNISMYGDDGRTNPEVINRSADLAGAVTLGSAAAPAEAGTVLRAGLPGRKVPTDNYVTPISKYSDTLYREMSPSEALADLPKSMVQPGGYGPMGTARKFYADQPDLALGQGGSKGVRVEYESTPFEGKINTQKPGWDYQFANGNAEYVAAPSRDANLRDHVLSFEVDPRTLSRVERAQYQNIFSSLTKEGWEIARSDSKIILKKPGNK